MNKLKPTDKTEYKRFWIIEYKKSRNTIDKPSRISYSTLEPTLFFQIKDPRPKYDYTNHRKYLPAHIHKWGMTWYKNGMKHNIHGSAWKDGKAEIYWLDGIQYTKEKWEIERRKYNE